MGQRAFTSNSLAVYLQEVVNVRRMLSVLIQKYRKKHLKVGEHVWIGRDCHLQGDIRVGNNVTIGERSLFVSTRAKLIIFDHVIFGPNVIIYTGDHATDIIGKHVSDVTDADKESLSNSYDQDVVIESGCWIGAGSIILKGVTIGRGSIVGAGSIVTRDVPPYSVYLGAPGLKVLQRFSKEKIEDHERQLMSRHGVVNSFRGQSI